MFLRAKSSNPAIFKAGLPSIKCEVELKSHYTICFILLADKRIYIQNVRVSRLCIVREENKVITYHRYVQLSNETVIPLYVGYSQN